ncbi:MAG: hypothetical protein IPM17_17255 [Verrucomicrobia bacterium]|nr:hypothetical protein [Verrucomicrobiota bacterium]
MDLTNNALTRVPFSLGNGSDTTLFTSAQTSLFRGLPGWRLQEVWHQQLALHAPRPRT